MRRRREVEEDFSSFFLSSYFPPSPNLTFEKSATQTPYRVIRRAVVTASVFFTVKKKSTSYDGVPLLLTNKTTISASSLSDFSF